MVRLLAAYWNCGPLVIATASLAFSFTALSIKFIGADLPPFETISGSALLCLLALSAVLGQQRLPFLPSRAPKAYTSLQAYDDKEAATIGTGTTPRSSLARVAILTLVRAVCGSIATTCFYLSLELLTLKDAVTLFFTSPVVASFLDWLLLGRSPGLGGAAATTLTLMGALCVTQPPFIFKHFTPGSGIPLAASEPPFFKSLRRGAHAASLLGAAEAADGGDMSGLGMILALVAAAANASGFIAAGLLRGEQHPLVLTWSYNLVLLLATALPLALAIPLPAVRPSASSALLLCAVASTQLVAQVCLNRGFQLESAGRGAAINVLQVLFSFILDVTVLHSRPSVLSVVGSSLVAAGVLFVALSGNGAARERAAAGGEEGSGEPGDGSAHGGSDADCTEDGLCVKVDGALLSGSGIGAGDSTVRGVPGLWPAGHLAEPLLHEEDLEAEAVQK